MSSSCVAQQAEGHPEVCVRDKPSSSGAIIAKVPNGQPLPIIEQENEEGYIKVRWKDKDGFVKRINVTQETFEFQDTNKDSVTLIRVERVVNVRIAGVGDVGIWEGFDGAPRIYKAVGRSGTVPKESVADLLAFLGVAMVAKQVDGHAEVVLKDSPNPRGNIVAKVPNGEAFSILADEGEYYKVRWGGKEGYVKRENLQQGEKLRSSLLHELRARKYNVPEGCDIESFGRRLEDPRDWGKSGPEPEKRRKVLIQTLLALGTQSHRDSKRKLASENVASWSRDSAARKTCKFQVISGDWGEVTLQLTRSYGITFAVLNMANAYVAGGGYTEGMPAQEENMFRRTDCHFGVDEKEYDQQADRYRPQFTQLINAADGMVFLDVAQVRTCIRGPEVHDDAFLGYPWLPDADVFPFYELRSAAVDLRGGLRFSKDECTKRIQAQIDTLIKSEVRHAVLSAFGCGAFLNPPETVAQCYCDILKAHEKDFDCVAFAVYYPGYGDDNFTVFKQIFERNGMR